MPEVALVTGAGRGIGAAIARRLAADGAVVGVADLDGDAAAEVAAEVGGLALTMDVAKLDDVTAGAAALAEHAGDLTLLVNNAGVTRNRMLHRIEDADWDLIHAVNLRGCANGFRAVAPWFRDKERSRSRRVVSLASLAGTRGAVGGAVYAAAKAGVVGLTRSMAAEWGPFGVSVNAVAPGVIATEMSGELGPLMRDVIPLRRLGEPEEVAGLVAFLCGPDGGYVSGQTIEIAGGLTDLTPPIKGDA
jgi:3-oxoacyl-[acyl-carrier protein] reductase